MRTHYLFGETWIFDLGVAQVEQRYEAPDRMHYRVLSGPRAGRSETVAIQTQLIRPGVFLCSWQEADGTTVVHLEDFADDTFYSHATRPDGHFVRLRSRMRPAPPQDLSAPGASDRQDVLDH